METREVQDKRRTASFAASAEGTKVVFSESYKYYHFRNDGGGTVYVSAYSDVGEGVDGTKSIADGGCGYVFSCDDHVFVKGAAKVTVEASNLPDCPFKSAQRGGDITAKGNPVQIDGLQGGVPFSEITVSGKNLLLGIVDLYPTANGNLATNSNAVSAYAKCNPNTTYTIQRNGGSRLQCMATQALPSNGTTFSKATTAADQTANTIKYTTPDNCNYIVVYLTGTAEEITDIQIEEGSTATEYEPPITGQNITLWACKKNLIPYPYYNSTQEKNGITITDNSDGTITVNGTSTASTLFGLKHYIDNIVLKKGTYTLSGSTSADFEIYIILFDINDKTEIARFKDKGTGITFKIGSDVLAAVNIYFYSGRTYDNIIIYPQLELGNTATAYEPYSGSVYTITPDSNPYVIPNDIRQQDGLNTISVSAGTLSVAGVRKSAAVKKIWDKLDELTTAIIVSNAEI